MTMPAPVRARSAFFVGLASIFLALVFAGFARTFFLREFSSAMDSVTGRELPLHLVVHAVVMTAWFSLFVVQTRFVHVQRVDLHRRLGIAAAAIAAFGRSPGGDALVAALARGAR